jgi:hypothetical protein
MDDARPARPIACSLSAADLRDRETAIRSMFV